jgi:phenylalanyl-tRNA synthetase beta chain
VPFTLPLRREMFGRLTAEQRLRRRCEDVLAGMGYSEAYTPSLVADDPDPRAVRVRNPMSLDQAVLRTTLVDGLAAAARENVDAGNETIALFELARVYLPAEGPLPQERWRLGAIVEGGFFRAKGAVETLHQALGVELRVERAHLPHLHPGKAARVGAGWLGELHPARLAGSWGVFELDLATLFAAVTEVRLYEEVIAFPPVRQDLALVVAEDVPAGELAAAAREAAGAELHGARVFDVYRGDQVGPGRKSVALALTFQSPERTLSDDDAAALRSRIVAALSKRFGATLRA